MYVCMYVIEVRQWPQKDSTDEKSLKVVWNSQLCGGRARYKTVCAAWQITHATSH